MNVKKNSLIVFLCICSQIIASEEILVTLVYDEGVLNIYKLGEDKPPLSIEAIVQAGVPYVIRKNFTAEDRIHICINFITKWIEASNKIYDDQEITNKVTEFVNRIENEN